MTSPTFRVQPSGHLQSFVKVTPPPGFPPTGSPPDSTGNVVQTPPQSMRQVKKHGRFHFLAGNHRSHKSMERKKAMMAFLIIQLDGNSIMPGSSWLFPKDQMFGDASIIHSVAGSRVWAVEFRRRSSLRRRFPLMSI